jgi:hypothetical protein
LVFIKTVHNFCPIWNKSGVSRHIFIIVSSIKYHWIRPLGHVLALIYRVFTKEWRGFKKLLNDYILQLDSALPPFSKECTRATQSCSPTALDRTCFKWRQPHTHTTRIWEEFDYRVDVCRVTQGAHIEGLWLMHKNMDSCRCWRLRFAPVRWEINFLLIFETVPFFLNTLYMRTSGRTWRI